MLPATGECHIYGQLIADCEENQNFASQDQRGFRRALYESGLLERFLSFIN